MCTACGRWYCTHPRATFEINKVFVGVLARQKLDPYELLDAMERSAREMV